MFLENQKQHPIVAAFTATATQEVREDISLIGYEVLPRPACIQFKFIAHQTKNQFIRDCYPCCFSDIQMASYLQQI